MKQAINSSCLYTYQKNKCPVFVAVFFTIIFLITTSHVLAQNDSIINVISGQILYPSGNPVAHGIIMNVYDSQGNFVKADTSDSNGRFSIDDVVGVNENVERIENFNAETNHVGLQTGVNFVYQLPKGGNVSLKIFDVKGELVKTVGIPGQSYGTHQIYWDGRDEHGQRVASGMYVYQISDGENIVVNNLMNVEGRFESGSKPSIVQKSTSRGVLAKTNSQYQLQFIDP